MRLGFAPSGRRTAAQAARLGARAEQEGFQEVWLSEDYCERGAFTVAGAVAASTSTVQVALGVVNPWTRHPVLLAMEAAALDELAQGRALLGLGASNERWMSGQLGIPFRKPITVLTECLLAVRDLLGGHHVQREVCGYPVDTALNFTPLRADLPLLMGVKGRIALERAAASADGIVLSVLSSPDYTRWVRAERGGAACPPLTAYVLFEHDTDTDRARDRLRPLVGRFLGVHGRHDITRVGGLDQGLAEEFRSRLVAGRSAEDLVTDGMLDTFAVVGDTERCIKGLRRFAAAGVDSLVVVDTAGEGTDPDHVLEAVARCAREAGLVGEPQ